MFDLKNLKQKFDNLLVQKIFSKYYYDKYYIRNEFLDTDDNFYTFNSASKQGFSICKRVFIYSHIYNNKFTFKSFLNKEIVKPKTYLKDYYNTLTTLKSNKKEFLFFLLKPQKGGYYSYYSGIIGFIPTSNVKIVAQKLFLNLKRKSFFIFFISNIYNINKTIKCFRFLLYNIKIKLLKLYKKRNFSSIKRVRHRKFSFNSIFLLKDNNFHYEIQEFKKKY